MQASLLQAQLFMLDFQAARWLMDGEVPKQAGNNHPTSIPTGVYRTRDGHMNIAVSGQQDLGALLQRDRRAGAGDARRLRDRGAALAEPRRAARRASRAHLRHRDTADWVELLNDAGVPCGPIYSIDEAFADPQVQHLGIVDTARRACAYARPAGDALPHARARRRATRRRRRAHRRGPARDRLRRRRDRAHRRARESFEERPRCTATR